MSGYSLNPRRILIANASALWVGATPTFQVDSAIAGTGLKVTGAAAGSGVRLTALSSGTNESILLTPKGTGQIVLPSNSLVPMITFVGNLTTGIFNSGAILEFMAGNVLIQRTNASTSFFLANIHQSAGKILGFSVGVAGSSAVDTCLSRGSPGLVAVGTGAAGSIDGTISAGAFISGGTAGVDFGPAAPASITVKKGIVTAIS